MVAGGDRVDADLVERLADLGRQAEAVGRVLRVDDEQVELKAGLELRRYGEHRVAAGAADDVAEKGYAHMRSGSGISRS